MSRKAAIAIVALLAVLGVCFWLVRNSSTKISSPPFSAAPAAQPSNVQTVAAIPLPAASAASAPLMTATSTVAPPVTAVAGAVASASNPDTSGIAPAVVVQNVRRAVRQYGEMFNGNPVGTNPEITAALAGNNPRKINFIDPAAGMRVNDKGEMIDPWGTPYFFHQISGTDMEIHSAGPDRIMWTADDLVAK